MIEVLESSWFSVNPLGGLLVYMEGGLFPREREVRNSEAVLKINYSP